MSPHVAVALLRLVWFDPADVACGSEVAARAEAAHVLAQLGARVEWRRGRAGETLRRDEVWVTVLGRAAGGAAPGLVLGSTRRGEDLTPVVWVREPSVRAAIGIEPGRSVLTLSPLERRALGVALGRVIAHEVVHARAPWVPHGTGLMAAQLSVALLTGDRVAVAPEVGVALRTALLFEPARAELHARFTLAPSEGPYSWPR